MSRPVHIARANWRHIAPVLIAVLLGVALVASSVNQYSVGLYGDSRTGILAGGPDRPIRSDEWLVRLPWLMAQHNQSFPSQLSTAGTHDAGIAYDLPIRSLQMMLKPHLTGYLFMNPAQGAAMEWWSIVLGCFAAVYLLLLVLGCGIWVSVALAAIVATNPGMHWWTVNPSFTCIMYGCLGTVLMLRALENSRFSWSLVSSILAGWMFTCAIVSLYPPVQIPVLVSLGLVLLVALRQRQASGGGIRWSSILLALGTFGALSLWFVLAHRSALAAMANTIYPGQRRTHAGGQDFASVLGAPFNREASSIASGSVNHTNQSENASSFLMSAPVVLISLFGGLRGLKVFSARVERVLIAWFLVLILWMMVPLPGIVGKMTFLDRVPPERIKPTIILVSALILGLHLQFHRTRSAISTKWTATGIFLVLTVWAGSHFSVNDALIPSSTVWRESMLWVLPIGIGLWKFPKVSLVFLATVSFTSYLTINPIRQDLTPITGNDLYRAVRAVNSSETAEWMTFTGTAQVRGILVATGVPVVTGVSPYPDQKFWGRFDPFSIYESSWNRYGHVHLVLGSGRTVISSPQADVIQVRVDPCAVGSPIASGSFFVETSASAVTCSSIVKSLDYLGSRLFILRKD